MNRRLFLKCAAMTGTVLSVGALSGCSQSRSVDVWLNTTLDRLTALKQQNLTFAGPWQAFATFSHLAQSIELSLVGFPEHKSPAFKTWVGKPAFSVFKTVGEMHHDTAEPIPGAAELRHDINTQEDIAAAITRLSNALSNFNQASETYPHFAYGDLTHTDYLIAHLLHIEDHLSLLG